MQKLIKSPEFYKTIDLIITPIILADNNDTAAQYVNRAFLTQIGYHVEDIPTQADWFNVAHPDELYRSEVKQNWEKRMEEARLNGDSHAHMVTRIRCADGSYKWFDVHENVFGAIKVVTFLDVDELQESYEELADVLKQKDILFSIIAHDVRSPLSAIRQVVEGYKELDLSAADLGAIFSGISIQIDYIFNIINSLLIRTSSERGSFIEKREPIALQYFFTKYEAYYRDRMEKQHIHFDYDIPGNVTVDFDPFVLDAISRNIIDNAIKYSPENGCILISYSESDTIAEITIRDSGPGMTVAQSEAILTNTGSRRLKSQITDSFGLGLVMAKEILEQHDGNLLIESEPGKGTAFIIRLKK
jgi:PAS domain S-box-containing protein